MNRITRLVATYLFFLSLGLIAQDRLRLPFNRSAYSFTPVRIGAQSVAMCQETPKETSKETLDTQPRKTVYGILALNPEGRLRSPDASDFSATSGGTTEVVKEKESWVPTAHVGFGFAAGIMDLEFLAGGGFILNEAFRAGFGEAMISPTFRLGKGVRIGPYVSFMTVEDADWVDDSKVRLEGGKGIRSGVSLGIGNETAWFTMGAGYMDFAFDATAKDGWDPALKELDLSGWLYHLGVTFKF
jgi:hypothetical protein